MCRSASHGVDIARALRRHMINAQRTSIVCNLVVDQNGHKKAIQGLRPAAEMAKETASSMQPESTELAPTSTWNERGSNTESSRDG